LQQIYFSSKYYVVLCVALMQLRSDCCKQNFVVSDLIFCDTDVYLWPIYVDLYRASACNCMQSTILLYHRCLSVRLSVCPFSSVIGSKRKDISSNFFE